MVDGTGHLRSTYHPKVWKIHQWILVRSNYSKLLVKKKIDFQKINEYSLKNTRKNNGHPQTRPVLDECISSEYLTWKSILYSFLLVFTRFYSKLLETFFFGNLILDLLDTRFMKATRVRVSTSVKKEVLMIEYSSEWVLSDQTSEYYEYRHQPLVI